MLQSNEGTTMCIAETEYWTFKRADEAWSKELQRLFGRDAGYIRYLDAGSIGPTLAPLYAEFRRAADAWHAAITKARGV